MFDRTEAPTVIKLAIMAVGGQGGGVLTNWVVALAESQGWQAQATAVAGVAQRTGATIYYVEMAPDTGRTPIFSLAPAPGDIDVLIAAEWMEAGRAVMRGFVTPDRTTLIASTHRAQAIVEKMVPGDGTAPSEEVGAAVGIAARDLIAFDMQQPAIAAGSVISATLFGALAGSGTLPFTTEAFEDTIRAGGRGVDQSLSAFRQDWRDRRMQRTQTPRTASPKSTDRKPCATHIRSCQTVSPHCPKPLGTWPLPVCVRWWTSRIVNTETIISRRWKVSPPPIPTKKQNLRPLRRSTSPTPWHMTT